MPIRKLNIFISHSSQSKRKAKRLGDSIKIALGTQHNIFLSSRLQVAKQWLTEINRFLGRKNVITIVLATPGSIKSPWVWFEIGASYRARAGIIPVCDAGLKENDLPDPLNRWVAVQLNRKGLEQLLKSLAEHAKAKLSEDKLEKASENLFSRKAKRKSK